MKYFSSIVIVTLYLLSTMNAQDTIRDPKMYKTWITSNIVPYKTIGVLFAVKDSSIIVSNSLRNNDYAKGMFETKELNIKDIEMIQIREKDRAANGMITGALVGAVAAAAIGLVYGDKRPCSNWPCFYAEDIALITAIPLMTIGAGIGAIIGSVKVKIPIGGSADNFYKNKTKLKEFSFTKE